MNNIQVSSEIKDKSALILAEIKKAKSILLHCHPSPDPDSVGSALAMKFAIEQLGRKVTVFAGDSEIPKEFMHFAGANDIIPKNFWDLDLSQYDLFIIQDSSLDGVSRIKTAIIPGTIKVINIDHHRTNPGVGIISIVDPSYPATAQLLYDIFLEMKIKITPEIAGNLLIGIFTDTGGFKFRGTSTSTFHAAAELSSIEPEFAKIISIMENSSSLADIRFQGLALSSLYEFYDGKLILSIIPYSVLEANKIELINISAGFISSILRKINTADIVGVIIEAEPNKLRTSFRTRHSDSFDVSILASNIGGGGHKGAAGAVLNMTLEEGKNLVVEKVKELYNL